ncbi:MAG: hypothetical protein AMK69_03110 [Nitrospira bacterium SG8_3]|nr:MAG: hypothetical protein AMK69_03110 [Nitrospira bacterium SG8_3]
MFEVLETAKKVAAESLQVQIDGQALVRFSKKLFEKGINLPPWEHLYHFYDGGEKTVSYLLVLDTLNFCFWPATEGMKWEIEYKSGKLSGYYALAVSLKQALESRTPIDQAEFLAELSLDGLKEILGGRGELQLLEQRVQNLNELGRALIEEYDGKASELVESAGESAIALVRILYRRLSSFRDVAKYRGHQVPFYKRAQILAADLYGAFQGRKWGRFTDMDKLTAFADYKLPQVLRHLEILRYAPELANKIDERVLIEAGSPEEVEIRANTIWAVELIRQELEEVGKGLKAFEIDWILWNLGQDKAFKEKPYHRTVTVFY